MRVRARNGRSTARAMVGRVWAGGLGGEAQGVGPAPVGEPNLLGINALAGRSAPRRCAERHRGGAWPLGLTWSLWERTRRAFPPGSLPGLTAIRSCFSRHRIGGRAVTEDFVPEQPFRSRLSLDAFGESQSLRRHRGAARIPLSARMRLELEDPPLRRFPRRRPDARRRRPRRGRRRGDRRRGSRR